MARQEDEYADVLHRTDERDLVVARIELNANDRRRKAKSSDALAGEHLPDADGVVGGSGDQVLAISRPVQRDHRVHVCRYDLGDASGQEVPDYHTTVVAADGQQRAATIETACDRDRDAVQNAVELLRIVLAELMKQVELHR